MEELFYHKKQLDIMKLTITEGNSCSLLLVENWNGFISVIYSSSKHIIKVNNIQSFLKP